MSEEPERVSAEDFDRAWLWRYRATPLRAANGGDVLVVLMDLGFKVFAEVNLRIDGLPSGAWGEAGLNAATAVDRLLALDLPGEREWPLRVAPKQWENVIEPKQFNGRWLADVYVVEADGSVRDVKALVS